MGLPSLCTLSFEKANPEQIHRDMPKWKAWLSTEACEEWDTFFDETLPVLRDPSHPIWPLNNLVEGIAYKANLSPSSNPCPTLATSSQICKTDDCSHLFSVYSSRTNLATSVLTG